MLCNPCGTRWHTKRSLDGYLPSSAAGAKEGAEASKRKPLNLSQAAIRAAQAEAREIASQYNPPNPNKAALTRNPDKELSIPDKQEKEPRPKYLMPLGVKCKVYWKSDDAYYDGVIKDIRKGLRVKVGNKPEASLPEQTIKKAFFVH